MSSFLPMASGFWSLLLFFFFCEEPAVTWSSAEQSSSLQMHIDGDAGLVVVVRVPCEPWYKR